AITLGAGSTPIPYTMPAVENINGQAITLSIKHKDRNDPKLWKGFKFAVPFDYSMHNYLLRYYVAEHGLDPDTDIQIRAVPPPEMVANLRADNIDGYLPAAHSPRRASSSPRCRTPMRRCSRRSSTPPRLRTRRRTASRSRPPSRLPTISTSRRPCSSRSSP